MSMIARFKKPGGLDSLIALLESCGTKKREALLKNIEAEDKAFAEMVKGKILTVDKVMQWDPLVVAEVVHKVAENYLALLMKGFPQYQATVTFALRDMAKKNLQLIVDGLNPKPEEIEIACFKFVEKVRETIKEGTIKLDDNNNPIKKAA